MDTFTRPVDGIGVNAWTTSDVTVDIPRSGLMDEMMSSSPLLVVSPAALVRFGADRANSSSANSVWVVALWVT